MKILFKPPAQTLSDPSVIARDLEYILFSRIMPLKVATSKSILRIATFMNLCVQVGMPRRLLQRFGSYLIQSLRKLCNLSPLYYKSKFHSFEPIPMPLLYLERLRTNWCIRRQKQQWCILPARSFSERSCPCSHPPRKTRCCRSDRRKRPTFDC